MFSNIDNSKSRTKSDFVNLGYEITSSLHLQMCLYLNVIIFPFWLIMTALMLYTKFHCLTTIYRFITVLVLVCLTVVEAVRLYLGYLGNLSEKVPELAGFWVLSLVLQQPLHLFWLFSPPLWPFPGECALEGIMMFLLISQLISGFLTLRKFALHQARRFHLQHLQHDVATRLENSTSPRRRESQL